MNHIRNFCIIAHIDHGKSTLADRMLEMTKTIEKRKMKAQMLDTMDLEQERGITIKLQPVTMKLKVKSEKLKVESEISNKDKEALDFELYTLNLIDTPGHVDFGYEVSRSLAAVEGAVLLVDSTQGVQAQTLANLYQAVEQGLEIIPVVNKIDLPNADVEKTKDAIVKILGCKREEIISASGKTGQGVDEILQAIVERVPAPKSELADKQILRALIFDSKYDSYLGVLAYVRIFDGEVQSEDEILLMVKGKKAKVVEVGKFAPSLEKRDALLTGEIGYIATGLKSVDECRVGDTITLARISNFQIPISKQIRNSKFEIRNSIEPLAGYKEVKPMVYASFYPSEGEDYNQFRDALEKLKLNDAALEFEGESSLALGKGFRIGFLGILHLEIIKERLNREFDFDPVVTTPGVVYEIEKTDGEVAKIYSASALPDSNFIKEIREPMVKLEVITPSAHIGSIMELVQTSTRSQYLGTEYIDKERVILSFKSPLSEVIVNLHDNIKSVSSGFASFSYEKKGSEAADLIRMDIYVADEKIDAFSQIVPRENVQREGNRIVKKLKDAIPRQNFLIKIQAAVGGKFIARENITPFRKDVTGYLYGGDITRKRKLLEKQKKGKKKMRGMGKAHIPSEAFLEVLKK